ncbi:hypothetical protein CYMTET_6331 [Cymbomonas tetramitiformis]|uniref:ShKT domain-containing protein n=1 Tax=Cymbomonas tetramitiformis TaxID=36881 RepID=A0AAE0LI09_9CHLO|nr:hypothetical protein CYMTET_6331 [Cymbomonas tetramitiformis]
MHNHCACPLLLIFLSFTSDAAGVGYSLLEIDRSQAFIGYSEKSVDSKELCKDGNDLCESWAEEGECVRNPHFMTESCRASCKICKPSPDRTRLFVEDPTTLKLTLPNLGDVIIRLRPDISPKAVAAIVQLARDKGGPNGCRSCRIYRNEAKPETGFGPPYALVQGSLGPGLGKHSIEGRAPTHRGTVCLIAQTSEFFISVGEHPEWNGSFIVWGEVEDMKVIDTVTTLPYKDFKHPQYGTVMRMLLSEIRFDMEME